MYWFFFFFLHMTFTSTQKRSLIVCYIVIIFTTTAYNLTLNILPVEMGKYDVSAVSFSLIIVSYAFTQFIFNPIFGHFSDVFGRKFFLVFCNLGMGLSWSLQMFATSPMLFYVSRALSGAFGGVIATSNSYMSDITKKGSPERIQLMGIVSACMSTSLILGPALGAILYEAFGFKSTILCSSLVFCSAGLMALFFFENQKEALIFSDRLSNPPSSTMLVTPSMIPTIDDDDDLKSKSDFVEGKKINSEEFSVVENHTVVYTEENEDVTYNRDYSYDPYQPQPVIETNFASNNDYVARHNEDSSDFENGDAKSIYITNNEKESDLEIEIEIEIETERDMSETGKYEEKENVFKNVEMETNVENPEVISSPDHVKQDSLTQSFKRVFCGETNFFAFWTTCMCVWAGFVVVQNLIIYDLEERMKYKPLIVSVATVVSAISQVLIQVFFVKPIKSKFNTFRVLAFGDIVSMGVSIILFFSESIYTHGIALFLLVICYSIMQPFHFSTATSYVQDHDEGFVLGLLQAASAFGRTVGPISGSFCYDINYKYTWIFTFFLYSFALTLLKPASKNYKDD
eukprot:TRINITY_DN405_c0_g1_i1.p1 TRINITY_DN405_c0_g1~~TRINITY_DN405_c0_g1_i1.p1  ORF type:complete len:571 (+),score=142.75 TRINITY_DN405_c0_g1_i1:44-1756(+)